MTSYFRNVVMVDPQFFDVEYAINPYMKDSSGNLNKIDRTLARGQWTSLKSTYENLGFKVSVLSGHSDLPDMVFAANQSFPYIDKKTNLPTVVMSQMRSKYRQPEVEFFRSFYAQQNYHVQTLTTANSFEGNGDAILRPGTEEIWGGYGFRTDQSIYSELQEKTGYKVQTLQLVSEYFYHLDTCFSFLDSDTIAVVPEAFNQSGMELIRRSFSRVILIDQKEALSFFAGNCHCPDGKNVILNPGSTYFKKALKDHGFNPIEVNTSEFMKSGGSVFCLKMMIPALN